VEDVVSREWVSYVFDKYATKEDAILSVQNGLHPPRASTQRVSSDPKIAEIRESKREPTTQSASQVLMVETRETAAKNKQVRASPAARRLMRENKIDPGSIIGSRPGSTTTANDVILAIQKSHPHGLRVVSTVELTGTDSPSLEGQHEASSKVKTKLSM